MLEHQKKAPDTQDPHEDKRDGACFHHYHRRLGCSSVVEIADHTSLPVTTGSDQLINERKHRDEALSTQVFELGVSQEMLQITEERMKTLHAETPVYIIHI